MEQVIDTSTHLTIPLLPFQYTSTIEVFDNKFVILYKNLANTNIPTTISIPKNTKGIISSILSKHLLPISSNDYSNILNFRPRCFYADHFYQAFKMYFKDTHNNPICNVNDPDKTFPKSTIFVYFNKDNLKTLSHIDTAYSTLLPLFKHLNKTYYNQDINTNNNTNVHSSFPPIIPVFESIFYNYLENFSFSFSLTNNLNEKECITTKVNIADNLLSITSYNLKLDKINSITMPDLSYKPSKKYNTYIKYHSIADILDHLNSNNIYISSSCLSIDTIKNFHNRDAITVQKIVQQQMLYSSLPIFTRTLSIKPIKLLGDLEVVSVEFPRVVSTISNTTTFNRLLNTVFVDDNQVYNQIKCKSFTKLSSVQKYYSVLDRLNALYVYCYDSIKANLDRIGLTTKVLKIHNGVTQSYPLVETHRVNNQESSFLNLKNTKRDLLQDFIKKISLCNIQKTTQPDKFAELSSREPLSFLNLLNKEGNINFESILYDSYGNNKLSTDYLLLNNVYGIFQKYLTNILPSLNFKCFHKDPEYQLLATKVITLYLYHLYLYTHTAITSYCFNQPELKLINHPDYPKISPSSNSNISVVRHSLDTLNEELSMCCYFFYVPRSIALNIASHVPLDMINSYNFSPAIVDTLPDIASNTTSPTNTTVTVTPETVSLDNTTKDLNNASNIPTTHGIFNTEPDPFEKLKDLFGDVVADIQKNLNKPLLDDKDNSNISDK